MCTSGRQRRVMCQSHKAIWSLRVLVTAATIALTVGSQRVGALLLPSAEAMKTQQRSNSISEYWEGQLKRAPQVSQTTAILDEITAYRRKAVRDEAKRWPDAIVPYIIDPSIDGLSSNALSVVKQAMNHWEKETCIRFVPANNMTNKDGIVIQQGSWCSSYVGRIGGWQEVTLAPKCLTLGTVIHELGHAIGWKHEHSRPDRDQYIEIMSEKIKKANDPSYAKYDSDRINTFGVPYDYSSIMHYAGSPNTLRAIDPTMQRVMGQRLKLSFYDVKLANLMYKCAEKNRCNMRSTICTGEGFVGPTCTCVCSDGSTGCAASNIREKPALRSSMKTLIVKSQ